jgi:Flp pilus assembly protein TadD
LGGYGDLTAVARGLEAAHHALDIDPQLASAYRGLALNLHQLGRLQEALPSYHRALALYPNYVGGLVDTAFGENTAGLFDQGLSHSKHALQLEPNTPMAYYHVGVALMFLDDDAHTERFLTAAAARFPIELRLPGTTRIINLLALLDLRRGRLESAVQRMKTAAEQAPNNIETQIVRAEVTTFAGSSDAPQIVRALVERAADAQLHNAPYPVKLVHAYYLQRAGATADATRILNEVAAANREALLSGVDWPMVFVQDAAVHALRGETTAALDDLDRAYAAGWRDGRTTAIDPLLASLRTEPRFQQVLSRIQSDVAAMRARADYSRLP